MTDEKNQCEKTQTKIELQIIPCANQIAQERKNVELINHESQDDNCTGKILLTVTCDGSKLTKADAGKLPDVDVSVRERCGSKLNKADLSSVITQ